MATIKRAREVHLIFTAFAILGLLQGTEASSEVDHDNVNIHRNGLEDTAKSDDLNYGRYEDIPRNNGFMDQGVKQDASLIDDYISDDVQREVSINDDSIKQDASRNDGYINYDDAKQDRYMGDDLASLEDKHDVDYDYINGDVKQEEFHDHDDKADNEENEEQGMGNAHKPANLKKQGSYPSLKTIMTSRKTAEEAMNVRSSGNSVPSDSDESLQAAIEDKSRIESNSYNIRKKMAIVEKENSIERKIEKEVDVDKDNEPRTLSTYDSRDGKRNEEEGEHHTKRSYEESGDSVSNKENDNKYQSKDELPDLQKNKGHEGRNNEITYEESADYAGKADKYLKHSLDHTLEGKKNRSIQEKAQITTEHSQIMSSIEFKDRKRHNIFKYLNSHYKGVKLDGETLKQIDVALTDDLLKQMIDEKKSAKKSHDSDEREQSNVSGKGNISTLENEDVTDHPTKSSDTNQESKSILNSLIRSSQSASGVVFEDISQTALDSFNSSPSIASIGSRSSPVNTLSSFSHSSEVSSAETPILPLEVEYNEKGVHSTNSISISIAKVSSSSVLDDLTVDKHMNDPQYLAKSLKESRKNQFSSNVVESDVQSTSKISSKERVLKLSPVSDPNSRVHKLMQLEAFQAIRHRQVQDYIDYQYPDQNVSDEQLSEVDKLILGSMRKDLSMDGSGLIDLMREQSGDKRIDEILEETKVLDSEDKFDNTPQSDDDSEMQDDQNMTKKSKMKNLSNLLKASHSNHSQPTMNEPIDDKFLQEDSEVYTNNVLESKRVEHEQGSVEKVGGNKEESEGFFYGIFSYFSNAVGDDEKTKSDYNDIKVDNDVRSSELQKDISLAHSDEVDEKPYDTQILSVDSYDGKDVAKSDAHKKDDVAFSSEEENEKLSIKDNSEKNDIFISDYSIDSLVNSSMGDKSTHDHTTSNELHEGSQLARILKSNELLKKKESKETVINHLSNEGTDDSYSVKTIDTEPLNEIGDNEDYLSHNSTDTGDNVAVEEDDSFDPLKKLCIQYPSLQACQAPVEKKELFEGKVVSNDFYVSRYIKLCTLWCNGVLYTVFSYVVTCMKNLVKVLGCYTFGILLKLMGHHEMVHLFILSIDSVSTEKFAVVFVLVINHFLFYWYFKSSTVEPVVQVTDGSKVIDYNKIEEHEKQLKKLMTKLENELKEKDSLQKKIDKDGERNRRISSENADLKKYMNENKRDKDELKDLRKAVREHGKKSQIKDAELELARSNIQATKHDLKSLKEDFRNLEMKYNYVVKELDSKDESLHDLEESKKCLEKELSEKGQALSERDGSMDELDEKCGTLEVKLSEMQQIMEEQKIISEAIEAEKKALQETLLNIDKITLHRKQEDNECEDEDGNKSDTNSGQDEQIQAERLASIIESTKTKAEQVVAVAELRICTEELSIFKKKATELEDNHNDLTAKFEILCEESSELKKSIEKKDIELSTISKFFGEREAELQRLSITQKEEIQKLQKQMNLMGDDKKHRGDMMKKIELLQEEIANNDKQFKEKLADIEEQSHSNYLKMRNAIRECDEHKREKEIYRKRLLDIDMSPKSIPSSSSGLGNTSDSPKSAEGFHDPSDGQSLPRPPPHAPPYATPMFRIPPPYRPNPMAYPRYRVPPHMSPYSVPPRPPFMGDMRLPLPSNASMNPQYSSNVPPAPPHSLPGHGMPIYTAQNTTVSLPPNQSIISSALGEDQASGNAMKNT